MAASLLISTNSAGVNDNIDTYIAYEHGGLRFSLQRGARGVASIALYQSPSDTRTFDIGRVILINDGSQAYIGTIDTSETTWLGSKGDRVTKISCVSLEQRFDVVRIPPRSYFNATAGSIASDLFTTLVLPGDSYLSAGTISAGATIASIVYGWDRVSEALTSLATQSGLIWYIDPASGAFQFRLSNSVAAPFTLTSAKMLWESMRLTTSRNTYRNRQIVSMSNLAVPPSCAVFAGDGATTVFTLPFVARQVLGSADPTFGNLKNTYKGSAGAAQATAQFLSAGGGPVAGDSATVNLVAGGSRVYNFVSALDNTLQNQVLTNPAPVAITRANNVASHASTTGVCTATLPNTTVAGHFLVVSISADVAVASAALPWVVTDTYNNTWKLAYQVSATHLRAIYYCDHVVTGGASHSVTVTSASTLTLSVVVAEYIASGYGFVDAFSNNDQGATTSYTSTACTPVSGQPELLIGLHDWYGVSGQQTPAAGWTLVTSVVSGGVNKHLMQDQIVASTSGSYSSTGTTTASLAVESMIVTFRWYNVASAPIRRTKSSGNPGAFANQARNFGHAASVSASFISANPATVGNTFVAVISCANPAGSGANKANLPWTMSDNNGNTWHAVVDNSASPTHPQIAMFYATITSAANNPQVTVTANGGNATYLQIMVVEYKGILTASPTDGTASVSGASSSTYVATPATPTYGRNDLIVGAVNIQRSAAYQIPNHDNTWIYNITDTTNSVDTFMSDIPVPFYDGAVAPAWGGAFDSASSYDAIVAAFSGNSVASGAINPLSNLADAINAVPAYTGGGSGVGFSLPTVEHPDVTAAFGSGVNLTGKQTGTAWNSLGIAATGGVGVSASSLAGGVDGTVSAFAVGLVGTSGVDLTYTVGSQTVTCAVAPAGGTFLAVLYRRLDALFLAVENTSLVTSRAAVERGPGKYQQMILDSNNASVAAVLLEAQQALAVYGVLPESFTFQTDNAGLFPGQLLTVSLTLPTGIGSLVNGTWVIQQVDAVLIPKLAQLRYTVTCISVSQVATSIDFWVGLAQKYSAAGKF